MAKQKKKLNKGLVAVLTIGAMGLTVVGATLIIMNVAQRDPQAFATRADELAKSSDPNTLGQAVDLYIRAYRVGRDSQYVVLAANTAYRAGDVGKAYQMLTEAHTLDPKDPAVLAAFVDQSWRLRLYFDDLHDELFEKSGKLLEVEPGNVGALIGRAEAARALGDKDASYPKIAVELFEKALAAAPNDPRVAFARSQRELGRIRDLELPTPETEAAKEYEKRVNDLIDQASTYLSAALNNDPSNEELVTELVRLRGSREDLATCKQVLERAIAARPTEGLFYRHLAAVQLKMARAEMKNAEIDEAKIDQLLADARRTAERAVELDTLQYDAYATIAETIIFKEPPGRLSPEGAQRYEEAVAVIRDGLDKTVGITNLRRMLSERLGERPTLITRGFELAMTLRNNAVDESRQESALKLVQYFTDLARQQYPTFYLTSVMNGELAVQKGETRDAIAAFEEAELRMANIPGSGAARLAARERLAQLYMKANEPGLARTYFERTVESYREQRRPIPANLYLSLIDLQLRLGESQKALDLVDSIRASYTDKQVGTALAKLRALALTKLGREGEVGVLPPDLQGSDTPRDLLFRAQLAYTGKDYKTAIETSKKLLALEPDNANALDILVASCRAGEQSATGVAILGEVREKAKPRTQRVIDSYLVVLTTAEGPERDEKLKAIIEAIPEANERNSELYNFYVSREKYDEAQRLLDELERLDPDKTEVLRQQFQLAVRREQLDRAEQYASKLSSKNADRAGGATYRGHLKFLRKDLDGAMKEYRTAERQLPTDSDLKLRIGQTLLAYDPPKLDDALKSLTASVDFDPQNFTANKLAYMTMERLGRSDQGSAYLERAHRLQPNDEYIANRKQILDENNDPRKGIAGREKRRQEKPDDSENLGRLSELYLRAAQIDPRMARDERAALFDKAREAISAAHAIAPADWQVAQQAARVFQQAGDRAGGEALLRKFIESSQSTVIIDGRLLLARFIEQMGDRAAAQEEFQEALRAADALQDATLRDAALATAGATLLDFYSRTNQVAVMTDMAESLLPKIQDSETQRRLRLAVIDGLMRGAEYERAGKALDEFAAAYPKDPAVVIARVQLSLAQPRIDSDKRGALLRDAREQLTGILKEDANNLLALYLRGAVSLELVRGFGERQQLSAARADLLRCKELAPSGLNLVHRTTLAQLYEEAGENALAEAEWLGLVELQPENPVYLSRMVQFYRRTKELKKAQQFLGERVARDKRSPYWPDQLGRLLLEEGEYGQAVRYLKEARDLYERLNRPNISVVRELMRAMVLESSTQPPGSPGRGRDAVALFEGLDQKLVTPSLRALAARAYSMQNQQAKAREQLELGLFEAIDVGPAELSMVANEIRQLTSLADGAKIFEKVLANASGRPGAMYLKNVYAAHLLLAGDAAARAAAEAVIDEVVATSAAQSDIRMNALLLRGALNDQKGQAEQAVAAYQEVLAAQPDHLEALNNLAYYLAIKMEKPAEALPLVRRLEGLLATRDETLVTDAFTAAALDTVGAVYLATGQFPQAESALLTALRLDPGLPEAHFHMGMTLLKQNRVAEAKRKLEAARDSARTRANQDILTRSEKALSEIRS